MQQMEFNGAAVYFQYRNKATIHEILVGLLQQCVVFRKD